MADALEQLTLNGESTNAMKISGSGSHVEEILDFTQLTSLKDLVICFRHVWTSAAATPVPAPQFFVGLCAEGKGYATGSSHAYGTLMFASGFTLDPFTFTDAGFYTSMFPFKSVGGVQTGLTSGYDMWVNRYEKAAGTQPFAMQLYNLGTGNWQWTPIRHGGAYNATDMSQAEFEAGMLPRNYNTMETVWDASYAVGSNALNVATGTNFPAPDEVTHGVLRYLNLWWDFPAGHAMYIHSINVQRANG